MKSTRLESITASTEDVPADQADILDAPTGSEPSDETPAEGWARRLRRAARMPVSRWRRAVLVVVVVLLLGGGTGGYFWLTAGRLPSGVALRVDGQDVTVSQLQAEAARLRALYGVQQPTDKSKVNGFWRSMAQAEAVRIILDHTAHDRNVVISDKAAQDVITRFVTQEYGDGQDAQAKFLAALGNAGTSETDVLDEIKHMLAVNQLFSQVTSGVTVTDPDVRRAYAQRRDQLGTPERRDIHNIVVGSKDEAISVVNQLAHGASFSSLARQVSLDDSTRDSGGDLGQVSASQLDSGYAKVAFAAPLNGVFGPVQSQYGWNVGQVTQILPPVPASFDTVAGQLKQELVSEKAMSVWRNWLSQQIRGAHAQYAATYRPSDPNALPASPQPGGAGATQSGGSDALPAAPSVQPAQ
ncbi:peptidylprolyl isomerase [Streptomyces sp. RB6PN25]|uniref:Peptidylprolyl isomerase n=1 Tax=Streptomyces humicola TaxID=2953240 RepID=A0ABT1PNH3_9ACTN|nr:peptidyl-prolyl cis-trans isomerase [Streptomyces humicola]MCQ4079213.1 peptidylprolyl isomerase [Streptomyces humicola]